MRGVDYEEIFFPVVRIASIRMLLTLVAHLKLELFQIDIKTAFLNGNLDEEIYMDQPIDFVSKGRRTTFVFLKDPSMVSNSLLECGILDSMKP